MVIVPDYVAKLIQGTSIKECTVYAGPWDTIYTNHWTSEGAFLCNIHSVRRGMRNEKPLHSASQAFWSRIRNMLINNTHHKMLRFWLFSNDAVVFNFLSKPIKKRQGTYFEHMFYTSDVLQMLSDPWLYNAGYVLYDQDLTCRSGSVQAYELQKAHIDAQGVVQVHAYYAPSKK